MCNGCHDPGMHVTLSTKNQPQETHCALSVFRVCVCVQADECALGERFGWDQDPSGRACLAIAIGALRRYHCQLSREGRGNVARVALSPVCHSRGESARDSGPR